MGAADLINCPVKATTLDTEDVAGGWYRLARVIGIQARAGLTRYVLESKDPHTWHTYLWRAYEVLGVTLWPHVGGPFELTVLGGPLTDEEADIWLTLCCDGFGAHDALQAARLLARQ